MLKTSSYRFLPQVLESESITPKELPASKVRLVPGCLVAPPSPSQRNLFSEPEPLPLPLDRRNDVRKGDAAEMYVIAKLLSWGYDAHGARRDLPYDVFVDLGPSRICRLQVKCRSQAQNDRWNYRVVRGNWRSATGTYDYAAGDYDAAVFFALNLEKAIFVPGIVQYRTFRTEDFLRPGAEIESWTRVINTLMPQTEAQ